MAIGGLISNRNFGSFIGSGTVFLLVICVCFFFFFYFSSLVKMIIILLILLFLFVVCFWVHGLVPFFTGVSGFCSCIFVNSWFFYWIYRNSVSIGRFWLWLFLFGNWFFCAFVDLNFTFCRVEQNRIIWNFRCFVELSWKIKLHVKLSRAEFGLLLSTDFWIKFVLLVNSTAFQLRTFF